MIIFSTIGQKWWWVPPPEMSPNTLHKKSPEMNELETDNNFLKISDHKFENKKSYRKIIKTMEKMHFFQKSFRKNDDFFFCFYK